MVYIYHENLYSLQPVRGDLIFLMKYSIQFNLYGEILGDTNPVRGALGDVTNNNSHLSTLTEGTLQGSKC